MTAGRRDDAAGTHAGGDVGDVDDPLIMRCHHTRVPERTAVDEHLLDLFEIGTAVA